MGAIESLVNLELAIGKPLYDFAGSGAVPATGR
jgi:hypothetical protein